MIIKSTYTKISNAAKYGGPLLNPGFILKSPGAVWNYFKFLISDKAKFRVNYQPVFAIFYPTNRCNSRCKICGRNTEKLKPIFSDEMDDLQLEEFKKMLTKLKSTAFIGFVGLGEPLLNRDIYEMAGYASSKNKLVILYTNGLLLDKDNIQKIISSDIYYLNVSLYGTTAEEFEKTTGLDQKNFYQVINNIKNLIKEKNDKKLKVRIHVSYVVFKTDLKKMAEMVNLTADWGIDQLMLCNYYPTNPYDQKETDKIFFEDDGEAVAEIDRLKKIAKVKITFPTLIKKSNFNQTCPYSRKIIYLDAKGNIGACNNIPPNKRFGNIFQEKDFFNCQHLVTARRIRHGQNPPYQCRFCRELSI